MFSKLTNSWELIKASWNVLQADKELIVFPIISSIVSLMVIVTFAIPTVLAGVLDELTGIPVLVVTVGFLFYAVMYFVVIFVNSALVGAATIRLAGGDPTVADGFRIARKHLSSILGYSLISATVGMVLRTISERSGAIGQLLISLVGFAWGVATFLVIPVLVVEGVGAIEAVKRSGALLKQTWGEQLVGNFSISNVFALIYILLAMGGIGATTLAAMTNSVGLIVAVALLFVLAFIILAMIHGALSGIYIAAVYRYATTGETAMGFDPDLIINSFKTKH